MGEVLDTFLNGRVTVVVSDITRQDVDAVVNGANSTLLGAAGWMVRSIVLVGRDT